MRSLSAEARSLRDCGLRPLNVFGTRIRSAARTGRSKSIIPRRLACRSIVGRTAAAVARDLPADVHVRFSVTEGTRTLFVPVDRLAAEHRTGWIVAGAHGTEAAAAVLPLVPPGTPVPTPPPDPECP